MTESLAWNLLQNSYSETTTIKICLQSVKVEPETTNQLLSPCPPGPVLKLAGFSFQVDREQIMRLGIGKCDACACTCIHRVRVKIMQADFLLLDAQPMLPSCPRLSVSAHMTGLSDTLFSPTSPSAAWGAVTSTVMSQCDLILQNKVHQWMTNWFLLWSLSLPLLWRKHGDNLLVSAQLKGV